MPAQSKKDMVREVEKIHIALSYDPVAGDLRWKIDTGSRAKAGAIAGSFTKKGYRQVRLYRKTYLAHRIAWLLHHGSWPSRQLDHINENKADNRLVNLRLATNMQNGRNRGKSKANTSGLKGVSWHKRIKRWQSQIRFGDATICLGYFSTVKEAHAAYCAAAIKYHGEFANYGVTQ